MFEQNVSPFISLVSLPPALKLRFHASASEADALSICEKKLADQEQLAAIGTHVAMIVHEARTPLTTIQMGLKHAQNRARSTADRQRITLALSEANRLAHFLDDILSYAKPLELHLQAVELGTFFNNMLTQIRSLPEANDRHIQFANHHCDRQVLADPDRLQQVFLNVFKNAFEAVSPGETIRCRVIDDRNPDRVCIEIHNAGEPIPAESLPKIATPFFSTKPSGAGLGLAISKRILTAHGGTLEVTSTCAGTTVHICLPRHR